MASVNAISGDSLEQDFLLEDSFAFDAQSDDEIDLNADLSTALYDSDSELPPAPVAAPIVDEDESRPAKKARKEASEKKELTEEGRKRKGEKKEKTKAAKKLKMLATEVEEVISLGTLPGALLAERVAEKQRRALPKLSGIEMEDLRIAGELVCCVGEGSGELTLCPQRVCLWIPPAWWIARVSSPLSAKVRSF